RFVKKKTLPPKGRERFLSRFFLVKSRGVLAFMSGQDLQQVAVSQRLQRLGLPPIVAQAGRRKDRRTGQPGFGLQPLQRGEGNPVSAIELVELVKKLGFKLGAGALQLRRGFGAGNFRNSHGLPASYAGELRLGRVRCYKHRALPVWFRFYFFFGLRDLCGTALGPPARAVFACWGGGALGCAFVLADC